MRFIHIADVHLGTHFSKSSFGSLAHQRKQELKETFYRLLQYVSDEKIELLLIAGDLFEEKAISVAELKEISYKFKQLVDTYIVIIGGNHDPLTKESVFQWVEWPDNVKILDTQFSSVNIESLNLQIYGMSWKSKTIQEPLLDNIMIEDKEKVNILLAHGDVYTKSEYLPISKSRLLEKGFDYIALGHIHKHDFISDYMAYSGSLEPLDFSETGSHGFIMGLIDEDQKVFEFVPFSKRTFEIRTLAIDEDVNNESMKDMIRSFLKSEQQNNFFRIRLEGYRDPHMYFDYEAIMDYFQSEGWYIEIIDKTRPSYNLEAILKENEDNLIGKYIEELYENAQEDETVQQALYYGLEALMNEKVKACS